MSVLRAMYTGVTGLNAEGEALGIVGDNISNVNTVGFKEQRGIFEDLLGHAVGDSTQPGSGVRLASVQQLFTQGALNNTGVATDLALDGDGFFVVSGNVAGQPGTYFTRAGQINLDKNGYFVNPDGLQLQGYAALVGGGFSATVSSLKVSTPSLQPLPTSKMTVQANVDANATTPALAWDAQNPSATSNFSTSITTYDSLGAPHVLSVYFRKTAANTWDYHVLANGAEVQGGTPGTNVEIGTGTLNYNTDGSLKSINITTPISVSFVNATPNQAIGVNFGSPTSGGGTGLDGITQFASPSNVSSQTQDGYASGSLAGVSVDQQGIVYGVYTNGQKLAMGELAVAKFASEEGLSRAGHNLWAQSGASGEATLGAAGSGGRGAVVAGALEQSNVDIAQQFVDLIAHQRAFQANSKTITTADEMLQELVALKR